MKAEISPRAYTANEYLEYQKKYIATPRESDKILLHMVENAINQLGKPLSEIHICNIGCSNGNFLLHMHSHWPQIHYTGIELFPEIVDKCRKNAHFSNMHFEVGDVCALPHKQHFDIVIANALLFRFDNEKYAQSLSHIYKVLKNGGVFLEFGLYTPYPQLLHIEEYTPLHPAGLTLYFRPMQDSSATMGTIGFTDIAFAPFAIPIDLPQTPLDDPNTSYTVQPLAGQRHIFRGALHQPWCHVMARKPL